MSKGTGGHGPLARPVGHDKIIERLERLCVHCAAGDFEDNDPNGDPPVAHAWLLVGPEGVGKFHTALWWASRLKCRESVADRPPTADPCTCPSCLQTAAVSHPDIRILEPSEAGEAIGIDEVRELIHAMALKPRNPGPRIAIVRDAQLLTPHAQSAMLKLLEEPPGFGIILLVSENLASILPTIRSRCQTLRFGPLGRNAIAQLLVSEGRAADFAETAATLSQGSAGRARELTPESIADRNELLTVYERFHAGDPIVLETLVEELVRRHRSARYGLGALYEWQMAKLEAALGYGRSGETGKLAEVLSGVEPDDASRLLEEARRIHATMGALERNANTSLAIRNLLLDLRPS